MEALGEIHFYGDPVAGVPRNPARALQHWRDAARHGSATAHANLGLLYSNGIGVEADNATAKAHFEAAANLGEPAALNGLGALVCRLRVGVAPVVVSRALGA